MDAKKSSHIGMIIGAISLTITFVVVMLSFFFKENFTITIEQAFSLIIIGIAPSVPFCPIYISIWIDKFIEYKKGKQNGTI